MVKQQRILRNRRLFVISSRFWPEFAFSTAFCSPFATFVGISCVEQVPFTFRLAPTMKYYVTYETRPRPAPYTTACMCSRDSKGAWHLTAHTNKRGLPVTLLVLRRLVHQRFSTSNDFSQLCCDLGLTSAAGGITTNRNAVHTQA